MTEATEVTEATESLDTSAALRRVYLDTNVYNALADALSEDEVRELVRAFGEVGVRVAVSPVNLWEVSSTTDMRRRDELVWVMQHASVLPLLPEVETIVARQMVSLLGDARLAGLRFDAPSRLSKQWALTRQDRRRTLVMEEGRDWIDGMKTIHRLIHAVAARGLDQILMVQVLWRAFGQAVAAGEGRRDATLLVDAIKRELPTVTRRLPTYRPVYGEVAAMASSLLLQGLTPYPDPIDAVVARLGGVHAFLADSDGLRRLLREGSVMSLAQMATEQARERYNAGNWFDAYHLQYLQVVPDVYTLDRRLLALCHRQGEGGRFVEHVHDATHLVAAVTEAARA